MGTKRGAARPGNDRHRAVASAWSATARRFHWSSANRRWEQVLETGEGPITLTLWRDGKLCPKSLSPDATVGPATEIDRVRLELISARMDAQWIRSLVPKTRLRWTIEDWEAQPARRSKQAAAGAAASAKKRRDAEPADRRRAQDLFRRVGGNISAVSRATGWSRARVRRLLGRA